MTQITSARIAAVTDELDRDHASRKAHRAARRAAVRDVRREVIPALPRLSLVRWALAWRTRSVLMLACGSVGVLLVFGLVDGGSLPAPAWPVALRAAAGVAGLAVFLVGVGLGDDRALSRLASLRTRGATAADLITLARRYANRPGRLEQATRQLLREPRD